MKEDTVRRMMLVLSLLVTRRVDWLTISLDIEMKEVDCHEEQLIRGAQAEQDWLGVMGSEWMCECVCVGVPSSSRSEGRGSRPV